MDFDTVTSLFNKVKNAVMNYTEYEIKVRDATNNDPWGASSTLMNEIASATWNFNHFSEIMTTIYKRLEESSSSEWRKVYKSLQLLEFLLKNGSENVLDSVKTHARDVSILESFHYIDDKGKDQGINVRHRAKEILELVNNQAKLQEERLKSKANKSKYTGVSSSGVSFSGPATYSKSLTESESSFKDFDKYKVKSTPPPVQHVKKSSPPPVQEVDLLDFGDIAPTTVKLHESVVDNVANDDWGEFTAVSSAVPLSTKGSIAVETSDDFGDFSFADFKSFDKVKSDNGANVKSVDKVDVKKDPYANLVNLDALGSLSVKETGPSLAALAKNK